jgi:hypothetical protein
VYLKLAEKRASERQDEAALAAIQARIRSGRAALFTCPHKQVRSPKQSFR